MFSQIGKFNRNKNIGQIMVLSTIVFSAILIIVSLSIGELSTQSYISTDNSIYSTQAQFIAESAVENAILEYEQNSSYNGGTFTTPYGSATVNVSYNQTSDELTVNTSSTIKGYTKKYSVVVSINNNPQITNYALYSNSSLYTNDASVVGNSYVNDNFYTYSSTFSGNMLAIGAGNGLGNYAYDTQFKTVLNVSNSGNIYVYNNTRIKNYTSIENTTYYKNNLYSDSTSNYGTTIQTSSLGNQLTSPSFNFSQAGTLASQNGTYFNDLNDFNNYLNSVATTVNGETVYKLPSGIYYVDCSLSFFGFCINTFSFLDTNGEISGTNVSIVLNFPVLFYGSINISSPYENNNEYYPSLAINGWSIFLGTNNPNQSNYLILNGLLYINGTIDLYGVSNSNTADVNGAIWSTDNLNLYSYTNVVYNSTYMTNLAGFNFPVNQNSIVSWTESP